MLAREDERLLPQLFQFGVLSFRRDERLVHVRNLWACQQGPELTRALRGDPRAEGDAEAALYAGRERTDTTAEDARAAGPEPAVGLERPTTT